MSQDASQIKFREYNFRYKNNDVGYVKMDQTMTELGFKYVKVDDTAQTTGIVAIAKNGVAPTFKCEMFQTTFENIFGTLAGSQAYPIIDGAKKAFGIGDRPVDLFTAAGQGVLHPTGIDDDDYADDLMYWKMVPDLSTLSYGGKRDNAQTVTMNFFVLRDDTKSPDFNYGLAGDWTATVNAAPHTVFITTEETPRAPYKHDTALTLGSRAKKQVYGHGFYKEDTTTTAAINEAGDITATTEEFDFDTLNVDNNFAIGDYLLCGTEIMQIFEIAYSAADAATMSVYRGLVGTTAAIHLDNAVLTKLKNTFLIPVTRRGTWASSAGDDVTVGDSNALNTKGLLTWVADGSDTITCTVSAVASPNLTVTATA
jgi:hypothetical protein